MSGGVCLRTTYWRYLQLEIQSKCKNTSNNQNSEILQNPDSDNQNYPFAFLHMANDAKWFTRLSGILQKLSSKSNLKNITIQRRNFVQTISTKSLEVRRNPES